MYKEENAMKQLETERLILRKFKPDDFDAVHSYASCLDNLTYMFWGPNNEEQTKTFILDAIKEAEEEKQNKDYQYAVILKETDELIGGCDIFVKNDEATMGWCLHLNYWKQGYGTELANALLRFGFDDLQLRRIAAHCDSENIGSYRVMEKIGMRREGLFLDTRPPHKLSNRQYSDELIYAMLKDEWETQKDIAYYTSLSVEFNDFIELPDLSDDTIRLVCIAKSPAIPEKKYVPSYSFAICIGSEKIGDINFRIGYSGFGPDLSSLYYGGQVGYNIDENYRGNGYAGRACRLLLPVAKAHKMDKLLITNNITNSASKRVCEKLGLKFIRTVRLPEWYDLYKEGQRFMNVYEWNIT